jgi:type II secretion system protein H
MSQRGFSMIELLVVISIIGIMSVMAYPYAASYVQASKLRAAAEELVAIINGARQLAITRNTSVCVSLSNNRAVYKTGTNPCASGATFIGAGTASDGTIKLQNDVRITGTTANVVFSPLGAASPAGTYTVTNPTNSLTMSVVVSTAGRVTIQ